MSRRFTYLIPLLIGFALTGLLIMGLMAEQERHLQASRLKVFYKLSAIRSGFENGINTRVDMAEAIRSLVVINPDIDERTFVSIAHGLFDKVGGVPTVMLAKGNTITHINPRFGQENMLDRNLLGEFPKPVIAMAERAIASRRTVISPPVGESRGEEVVYALTPIYLTGNGARAPYWGMVVVVMETQDIYREAGLSDIAPLIDVAVREPVSEPGHGKVLHGRKSVFQSRPVIMDVPIPGGYWQLGGVPSDGWTDSPNRNIIIYGGGFSIFAFVLLLLSGLYFSMTRLEAREKYQYLIQNARSIILRIDMTGIITFCNEHAEEFYGYDHGELIGKPLVGTIIPEVSVEGESMKRYLNRLLQDPAAHPFNENMNICKNGEMVWVAWANEPVYGRNCVMQELLSVGTDITDRKLMEEALKARERQYRMLAENVSDIILGLDPNLDYTYVSPSDEPLRGFPRHEVLGRPLADFLAPPSADLMRTALGDFIAQAGEKDAPLATTLDLEFTRANGSTVWLETRFVIIRNEEKMVIGVQGVGRDISDRKRAEALRDDMERMARHDLKTPLGAVVGLPDEIRQLGGLDESQEAMLATIEKAGDSMLQLINRSLDLYKMESGSYRLKTEPVNVLDVLEHIKNETRSIIRTKGVSVGIEVVSEEPDGEFRVMAEYTLLLSMMSNLMLNALQASPNGSAVMVTLDRKGGTLITITNKGEVPPRLRDVFFEKYTSGEGSDGSGLGTYSARLIARTHGGDISLDCSSPEFTRVIITLP